VKVPHGIREHSLAAGNVRTFGRAQFHSS